MRKMRDKSGSGMAQKKWPGDPEGVGAEDIDFGALAHVLANTCLWGGRTARYHSLAAHGVIVSEEVEALDGMAPEGRRRLALYALLADAPAAWLGNVDRDSGKARERASRLMKKISRAVHEAAGLAPEMDGGDAELLRLMGRMAGAAGRRDLADAGAPAESGVAFPPLRRRIRPMDPDRAAKAWLKRFRVLSGPSPEGAGGAGGMPAGEDRGQHGMAEQPAQREQPQNPAEEAENVRRAA